MTPGVIDAETSEWLNARRATFSTKPVRQQFGESLVALGREFPEMLALTADLMYATGIDGFGAAFPGRLINLGIAEQNMTGVAAGLALCGKLPIVCGYAAFTTLRAAEQAKLDCAYNNVKVILTGQSAGLSYGVGGPTHQTYEDVAIMRAIPNMLVLVPADPPELHHLLRASILYDVACPIYLRLGRGPEYVHMRSDAPPAIGKAAQIRQGSDICIIAMGPMVFEAALASDALARDGIGAAVLNIHTVKPIDREAILNACAGIRGLIVAEEHTIMGGLGAAVLEVLEQGHDFPVKRIGIADHFPPIGPPFQLRASLGLAAEHLVREARALVGSRVA